METKSIVLRIYPFEYKILQNKLEELQNEGFELVKINRIKFVFEKREQQKTNYIIQFATVPALQNATLIGIYDNILRVYKTEEKNIEYEQALQKYTREHRLIEKQYRNLLFVLVILFVELICIFFVSLPPLIKCFMILAFIIAFVTIFYNLYSLNLYKKNAVPNQRKSIMQIGYVLSSLISTSIFLSFAQFNIFISIGLFVVFMYFAIYH